MIFKKCQYLQTLVYLIVNTSVLDSKLVQE